MAGEGGWTEVAGCPVFTNDDGAAGVQAMTDILAANPDLDAFGIMGGWPLFGAPEPYRALFGQRPFEMGYLAPGVMIRLINGEAVADPVLTGLDECTRDTVETCIQK